MMVDKKSYTAADDCEVEEMRWTVSNHLPKSLHIKTKVLKQKSPDKPNFSLKKKQKATKLYITTMRSTGCTVEINHPDNDKQYN